MEAKATIETKAMLLRRHLNEPQWLTSIGLGKSGGAICFYVYANNLSLAKKANIPDEWFGVPIIVKHMRQPYPA